MEQDTEPRNNNTHLQSTVPRQEAKKEKESQGQLEKIEELPRGCRKQVNIGKAKTASRKHSGLHLAAILEIHSSLRSETQV